MKYKELFFLAEITRLKRVISDNTKPDGTKTKQQVRKSINPKQIKKKQKSAAYKDSGHKPG